MPTPPRRAWCRWARDELFKVVNFWYEKGVRGVWNLLRIQYTLGKGYVLRAQTGSDNSLDVLRSRSFD